METFALFSDEAPAALPDDAGQGPCSGDDPRPTDHRPGDALPPAPGGPVPRTSLSAFDGTDPTSDWRLYALDDSEGGEGCLHRRLT